MIVVDSNVIVARTLTSVLTSKAEKVEQKDPVWIVPVLWRYEFQNILATAMKAKQITPEHALGVWQRVAAILVENESEPSPAKVIDLVAQYGITAYDGQFIALAMEMGIPCITEDQELQEKFRGIALSMDDFLGPQPSELFGRGKRDIVHVFNAKVQIFHDVPNIPSLSLNADFESKNCRPGTFSILFGNNFVGPDPRSGR